MWRLVHRTVFGQGLATIALTIVGSATSTAYAQSAEVAVFEATKSPVVVIDPDERISGGARVGAAFGPLPENQKLDKLFVYFDREPAGDLEVRLTSIDGRFLATFAKDGWSDSGRRPAPGCAPSEESRWEPPNCEIGAGRYCGWVELTIHEDVEPHLERRNHQQIAPLVLDQNNVAYPVRWGSCEQLEHVRLHINAEGARAFFVAGEGTMDCKNASETSGFKFDRVCDVPIDKVTEDRIYILRKRGAGFSDPIEFNIILPRVR